MTCKKCGSEHVAIQAVSETKEKRKKGVAYWCFVGWWWEPIAWLCFTPIKLLCALFGKKTKIKSKTKSYAVCQDCGCRWEV
jgi:hypothetical protein